MHLADLFCQVGTIQGTAAVFERDRRAVETLGIREDITSETTVLKRNRHPLTRALCHRGYSQIRARSRQK